MSVRNILETFIGFFLPLSTENTSARSLVRSSVVEPASFVFSPYPGHNATCPLSSCSNKNDGHAAALTVFLRLLAKEPFV